MHPTIPLGRCAPGNGGGGAGPRPRRGGYVGIQRHVCHGSGGLGSSYARGLIDCLAGIGYEAYLEAVMYRVENVTRAQQSGMPACAEVEEVANHVDDIYSYLKARVDGVIGRGRPERLAN